METSTGTTPSIAAVLAKLQSICLEDENSGSNVAPWLSTLLSDPDVERMSALGCILAPKLDFRGERRPFPDGPFKMWLQGDLDAYPDLVQKIQQAIAEGGFA